MNTNRNPSTFKKVGTAVRHLWDDQVAAQRALLRRNGVRGLPPYDDYLLNRRGHGR